MPTPLSSDPHLTFVFHDNPVTIFDQGYDFDDQQEDLDAAEPPPGSCLWGILKIAYVDSLRTWSPCFLQHRQVNRISWSGN